MSQRAVLEPFTKFLAEAYRGKVNHFKNALSNTGGKFLKQAIRFSYDSIIRTV